MLIRALTWNVFHGRDFPPDGALRTRRSRILRITERNRTHAQVNRDLRDHFFELIASTGWDVALLQELPPPWAGQLAERCAADGHLALTSRNSLAPLRRVAACLNPDLTGSNEGGSNMTLVRRRALGRVTERRELALCPGPVPERRVMSFTRTESGICVTNLHASTGPHNRARAERELRLATERSAGWAEGAPMILGGDLNIRPRDSRIYDELRDSFGFAAPTHSASLDHLLASGLATVELPSPWPPERREVTMQDGLRLRLSDHAPVEAVFRV
ncbi:MAG: endonuclease/exonuclease/phosphatase family protein [Actinomycetota bacterium]|nr:endonuclease/exonuclease/phosphatase family protein [Actinomycetota bacterium]